MHNRDIISILLTFILGIFIGAYTYLYAVNGPKEEIEDIKIIKNEFAIVGESYGACEADDNCFAFNLNGDGSYTVQYQGGGDDPVQKKGVLPKRISQKFVPSSFSIETLKIESRAPLTHSCYFGEDGTNFKFRITKAGVDYHLDTCLTDINYEGDNWYLLSLVWNYLAEELS